MVPISLSEKIYVSWTAVDYFLERVMNNKPADENNRELAQIIIKNILDARQVQLNDAGHGQFQIMYRNAVFWYRVQSLGIGTVTSREDREKVEWKYTVPEDFSFSTEISDQLIKTIQIKGIIPQQYITHGRFIGSTLEADFVIDTFNKTVCLWEDEV